MTDTQEIEKTNASVKQANDSLPLKSHWRRLISQALYFQDGNKKTIRKRIVSWLLLASLPFMTLLLWLRDSQTGRSNSGGDSSEVGLPGQLIQGKVIEVPPLAPADMSMPAASRTFLQGGTHPARPSRRNACRSRRARSLEEFSRWKKMPQKFEDLTIDPNRKSREQSLFASIFPLVSEALSHLTYYRPSFRPDPASPLSSAQ